MKESTNVAVPPASVVTSIALVPSYKLTVPAAFAGETVAVSVTDCPKTGE